MVLVNAKVLVDVLADDPAWREWSETRLLEIAATEELAINPIIFAEVSAAVERALPCLGLVRLPIPYEAGFIAAQAFVTYRRGAGAKRSPLPDFYIGAHAQTANLRLLTRDAARYRTYFPKVRLITPE